MIEALAAQILETVSGILLDTSIRIAPVYLLATIFVAFILFHWRRGSTKTGFWRWLAPRDIYFHASHKTDIKLFLVGTLLSGAGLFNAAFLRTAVSVGVVLVLSGTGSLPPGNWGTGAAALATIAVVLVNDFCIYWTHRLHHEQPVLWPFHAVHHSAEVMTPLTLYRKHPVYDLISGILRAVGGGVIFGLLLVAFGTGVDVYTVGGANLLYVLFSALGGNLRHSHIWLAYPAWLEHILISPAQHQIHHSLAPEHHNKNYGEVFALWDWWFGSLYLAGAAQDLKFGLNNSADGNTSGSPLQPHPSLLAALMVPFREAHEAATQAAPHAGATPASAAPRGEEA